MRVLVEQRTYVKRVTVGRPISSINEAADGFDSADVRAIVSANSLDSAETISLIDSAYVQARQVDLQRDSSFITSILDSSLGALTNSIIPHLDSSIDLGSSTKKFRTLFLSGGTIKLGSLSLSDSGGQFVARDSDLNKTKMDLAANSTTDLSEGDNLYYTRTRFDSAAISFIDSAYVQARQVDLQRDSSFITNIVDSAYVLARAPAQDFLDSSEAINLIDSAYVQARQIQYNTSNFTDSAFVTTQINNLIDGAPGTLDTLNEIAAALNDDDSAYNTLIGLIAAKSDFDSADAIQLIDSDYIISRINVNNLVDSAFVAAQIEANSLDSERTINLIDSSYVQSRQALVDSASIISLVDSSYVQSRVTAGTDSAATISLITSTVDSAYVVARAGGAGTDSAAVIQLIDSSYVQARQSTTTPSITIQDEGVALSSAATTLNFVGSGIVASGTGVTKTITLTATTDSASVIQLIDSDYIISRINVNNLIDSAYVESVSLDSERTINLIRNDNLFIDSAYVTAQINALIAGAPGTLDTLDEIAAALNDDDSAYGTLLALINAKSDVDSTGSLSNVTYGVPTEGQILKFDAGTSKFILATDAGGLDSALTSQLIDSDYVSIRSRELENSEFKYTLVDAGNVAGPRIVLDRNSSSPADSDALAQIEFRGRNDADSAITYAKIETFINDASADSEDAELHFTVTQSGIQRTKMKLAPTGIVLASHERLIFDDDSFQQALIPGDYTANHGLTLPDSTGTILTREFVNNLIDSAYVQRRQSNEATGSTLDFADSAGTVLVSLPIVQAASIATGAVIGFGNSVQLLDKDSAAVTISL